jgi:uncharacterized membrane protein YjjB (DUF3815 family)
MPGVLEMLLSDVVWSALAALGFAVLFNVPRRALPMCAIAGAVGHAIRTIVLESGADITTATLVGAIFVGFLGTYFARIQHMPSVVFSISGAIPLVPGVFAFRTMINLLRVSTAPNDAAIQEALLQASTNGITTGLVLAALATGIAAPTLLFERRRPVV